MGVRNKLQRFIEESECHVAISLHSPLHEERMQLMPAEKGMPVSDVVELLRHYDFAHQRRLSFEYIVFGGLNDTPRHAKAIVNLLRGLDCRITLIRFHDGVASRLLDATWRLHHHPGIARPGHLCRLRTTLHG